MPHFVEKDLDTVISNTAKFALEFVWLLSYQVIFRRVHLLPIDRQHALSTSLNERMSTVFPNQFRGVSSPKTNALLLTNGILAVLANGFGDLVGFKVTSEDQVAIFVFIL